MLLPPVTNSSCPVQEASRTGPIGGVRVMLTTKAVVCAFHTRITLDPPSPSPARPRRQVSGSFHFRQRIGHRVVGIMFRLMLPLGLHIDTFPSVLPIARKSPLWLHAA